MDYYTTRNTETQRVKTIVILSNGQVRPVEDSHSRYEEIVELLKSGTATDEEVVALIESPITTMVERFVELTDRIAVSDGVMYVDGDPAHNAITEHILRMLDNGDDSYANVVRFYQNLLQNPSEQVRADLFDWLTSVGMFALDERGNVLGYKAVDAQNKSMHFGYAYVNGQRVDGKVPYALGTIVTMPRSDVDPNSSSACSTGLHVGTWEYAESFGSSTVGSKILHVFFNPRDVVAVPSHDTRKLRVCRLGVLDVTENKSAITSFESFSYGDEESINYYDESYIEDEDY